MMYRIPTKVAFWFLIVGAVLSFAAVQFAFGFFCMFGAAMVHIYRKSAS